MYRAVMPITDAVFVMGEVDTQVLAAVEAGQPLPQGEDYQHGPSMGTICFVQRVLKQTGVPVRYAASPLRNALSIGYITPGSTATV